MDWMGSMIEFLCSLEHPLIPEKFVECIIHAFVYADQKAGPIGATIMGVEAVAQTENDCTFLLHDYHGAIEFIESGFTRLGDRRTEIDDLKVRFCEMRLTRLSAKDRLLARSLPKLDKEDVFQAQVQYVQQWEDEKFDQHSTLLGVPLTLSEAFLASEIGGFTAHSTSFETRGLEKPAFSFIATKDNVQLELIYYYTVLRAEYEQFRHRLRVWRGQHEGAAND